MSGRIVMAAGNMEDISFRLNCCHSLLCVLAEKPGVSVDALSAVADLLNSIRQDFEADIAGAEEVQG